MDWQNLLDKNSWKSGAKLGHSGSNRSGRKIIFVPGGGGSPNDQCGVPGTVGKIGRLSDSTKKKISKRKKIQFWSEKINKNDSICQTLFKLLQKAHKLRNNLRGQPSSKNDKLLEKNTKNKNIWKKIGKNRWKKKDEKHEFRKKQTSYGEHGRWTNISRHRNIRRFRTQRLNNLKHVKKFTWNE